VDPIAANELQIASYVQDDMIPVVAPRPIDLAPENGVLGSTSRAWASLTG
jgi:hypothetical protein